MKLLPDAILCRHRGLLLLALEHAAKERKQTHQPKKAADQIPNDQRPPVEMLSCHVMQRPFRF